MPKKFYQIKFFTNKTFTKKVHFLFKIKLLTLPTISQHRNVSGLTIDWNPPLQRVQFDQNLSPIRDNDPRVYRARVAWKGRRRGRRYRLPLSWDIIGHGRAIRMPDWPHTTSISRGKLTRSWLNGKRYHTISPPHPFRNWLVLEFQGI